MYKFLEISTGFLFFQAAQDQLLLEEIKLLRASDCQILPPLKQLQNCMQKKKLGNYDDGNSLSFNLDITACMRDLYHYARVAGLHVLECIMETVLLAVKNEQLEEASCVRFLNLLTEIYGLFDWEMLWQKLIIVCRFCYFCLCDLSLPG